MNRVVCPSCGGRGVSPGWDYCERCQNTGWVVLAEVEAVALAEPVWSQQSAQLVKRAEAEQFRLPPWWNPFNGRRGRR